MADKATSAVVSSLAEATPASYPIINRDLSWLQFNMRVLEEAEDKDNPLLERVKFLAITSSNLDEFQMVRVSALLRLINAEQRGGKGEEISQQLLEQIDQVVRSFLSRKKRAFIQLQGELAENKIIIHSATSPFTKGEVGKELFTSRILPHLSAPESFSVEKLKDLANLAVAVILPGQLWLPIPRALPLMYYFLDSEKQLHFFFLDHLLLSHLWPQNNVQESTECGLIRITRGADQKIELSSSDPEVIPDMVLAGIKSRDSGLPVRLQLYPKSFSKDQLETTQAAFKINKSLIYIEDETLFLRGLWSVSLKTAELLPDKKELAAKALVPKIPPAFRNQGAIFSDLERRDYLLHHPYDSFDAYVAFIEAACSDKNVSKIEQTIYRMDAVSPVIKLLCHAAPKKEVHVVIELRARFDELNNLYLAEELRKAGVKVTFASGNLKLHAKIALITRSTSDGERYYTHLSTGNYNAATARQYTDLGLLTANPEIGQDARLFFDAIYSGKEPSSFKRLVIAPQFLARRIFSYIKAEAEAARQGKEARIFAKVNTLVDQKVIEALYEASRAGVRIDLVVRGACSLVPELPGLSENIRVISVVDRFLEHSRIYYFENSAKLYLSSADWMPRNFFSRLEIAYPVLDKRVFSFIKEIVIPAYLRDNIKARRLNSKGEWKRVSLKDIKKIENSRENTAAMRAQLYFTQLAEQDYLGTPLWE
jgi:polyphosphate kinase